MARTRQSCGSIVDTRISRCRAILRGAGCCSSCHGYRHLTTCAAATNVIVQRDHSRLHGGGGSIAPTADNPQGRRRCFRPLPTTVSFCVKMHQNRVLLARIRRGSLQHSSRSPTWIYGDGKNRQERKKEEEIAKGKGEKRGIRKRVERKAFNIC